MTVNATEAAAGGLWTSGADTNGTATANGPDKQMFLNLLVAQLRYQDPMNPTDSSAFLSQTAQFQALEAMQTVAEQSSSLLSAQLAFGASSLLGRSVTYPAADGTTGTGMVRGVTFGTSGPVLDVDGIPISLSDIHSVTSGTTTSA